jgi:hypothetical protein
VAVVGDGEPAGLEGSFLFAFECSGEVFLGEVGCDGLEDLLGEDREGLGVVVLGLCHQMCFGLGCITGKASTHRMITAAWSSATLPAAIAVRVASCRSNAAARASRCLAIPLG